MLNDRAETADPDGECDAGSKLAPRLRRAPKPVLIVLHQPHSNPGHVGQWLARQGYGLDIRRPRYGDELPKTLEEHAGAVIFGGPMSANDADQFIGRETEWIGVALREEKPFLGICLGAQMLARHLGARVCEHPKKCVEIGYYEIKGTGTATRFCDWPAHVYQWHREGFDLAHGAESLAVASGDFENQAFSYGPAAVGLQFHPEITYAMVNRWTGIGGHRLAEPGAQDRRSQLASHIAHGPAVRRWLDSFMRCWLASGECPKSRSGVCEIATV
jgi:GMP synthase (glutamine-hydrolysing)